MSSVQLGSSMFGRNSTAAKNPNIEFWAVAAFAFLTFPADAVFFLMCCSELSKATHLCFFLKRRLSAISQMQLQQIPRTAECSLADTFASRVVELQSQDSDAATSWKPYESLRRRCILWVVLFGQNLVFKLRLKLWAHLFQMCQSRFDFLLQNPVTLVGLSLKCMKSKV